MNSNSGLTRSVNISTGDLPARHGSAPDIAMLRSEHAQLNELIRVVIGTAATSDFAGLIDQLRWMIRDHVRRERSELAGFAPAGQTVDSWARLTELERLADELGSDESSHRRLAEVTADHCDHLESEVFPVSVRSMG